MKRTWPQLEDLLLRYGMKQRCVSVRAIEMSVLETETKSEKVFEKLAEEGRKAINADRADVLLLGCAGMSGLDKDLQKALGVPVLDGVVCALKMAEGLIDYQVSTSKISAFKYPEPKNYKRCSDAICLVGSGSKDSPNERS
jgi:allantoin racemase